MKVYIVILKDRSGNQVEKVFSDREIAEKYAKLHSEFNYTLCVEEYGISNSDEIKQEIYAEATYCENSPSNEDGVGFKIRKLGDLNLEEGLNKTYLIYCDEDRLEFSIKRPVSGDYDEEVLRNDFTKACHKLASKIRHLVEVEGACTEYIEVWIDRAADSFLLD